MMRLRTLTKSVSQNVLFRTLSKKKRNIAPVYGYTNLLADQQCIIKCISYLKASKQLKASGVTKSIYFLKCSEVKDTFPIEAAIRNIPAIFDELMGRNNYSEDCLVKIFCDFQNLLVNKKSVSAVGALKGCDFFAHYLLHVAHSTAVIVECLNIISLLCVESLPYDRDSNGKECDNFTQFNKIDALIPGVMNILVNPALLQSSVVVIAACKTLERLIWCRPEQNHDGDVVENLLVSNLFATHHNDPAVLQSLFKLLQLIPTYDVRVALDHNFGGILHTQLSIHLDNVEMVQLIMQCAFHYHSNLNSHFVDGLEKDNSQVLRLICDDVFCKYSSNADIMLVFCKIVEHCCNEDSSGAKNNKCILSQLGYCERLIEIHNIYEKMEGSKAKAVRSFCNAAMVYMRSKNNHISALKLIAYK